ncbi:alpha/beta fold hydrolase [Vibrio sp. CK2-1]|uniref:alpha/beta fold hydrolase n=1 Tax=Vibrio sp. CK2-1 TaxID=2912249 RepID=UPI001F41202A|nr:alpha/beta fold hydrolase [Vibrio sp. CK2-1]MCF7354288.1 alpha/beta fold hydrolase [Vibrio sp. CK2-1]
MSLESQQHKIMIDGDDKAAVTVLLAHGAGAGMDHEFMSDMAEKLAAHGVRVVRFNFPYMVTRAQDGKKRPPDRAPKLLADFEEKINAFHREGQHLFLVGKSMGGRMASHLSEHPLVTGVMCLGFPFHPPGKPENYKGEHLVNITKPTLILQGERDTFGTKEECQSFAFSDAIHVDFIPDGDHSLKPRVKSGFTEQGNRALAVSKMMAFIEQHTQN